MKSIHNFLARVTVGAMAFSALSLPVTAYPPAPSHIIYGLVRDEMGNPLANDSAVLILETTTGTQLKAQLIPDLAPGINYQITVPMDSGIGDGLYTPTAARTATAFRIQVMIGKVTYLPIEMKGDMSKLGQPGLRTRVDLTLGEDANGNGLPDAWERAYKALYGVQDLKPGDHVNGNPLSVMDQYVAGIYEEQDKNGLSLRILHPQNEVTQLEFLTVRGRTYTLQGSAEFTIWKSVLFRFADSSPDALDQDHYYAADTRMVKIVVKPGDDSTTRRFFKLLVQ